MYLTNGSWLKLCLLFGLKFTISVVARASIFNDIHPRQLELVVKLISAFCDEMKLRYFFAVGHSLLSQFSYTKMLSIYVHDAPLASFNLSKMRLNLVSATKSEGEKCSVRLPNRQYKGCAIFHAVRPILSLFFHCSRIKTLVALIHSNGGGQLWIKKSPPPYSWQSVTNLSTMLSTFRSSKKFYKTCNKMNVVLFFNL